MTVDPSFFRARQPVIEMIASRLGTFKEHEITMLRAQYIAELNALASGRPFRLMPRPCVEPKLCTADTAARDTTDTPAAG